MILSCMVVVDSLTRKKSPNVYKSCPKIISLEKWWILTPLQNLPKNVGDWVKLIVVKSFKKLPKVQKIAKSGHTTHQPLLLQSTVLNKTKIQEKEDGYGPCYKETFKDEKLALFTFLFLKNFLNVQIETFKSCFFEASPRPKLLFWYFCSGVQFVVS